MSCQKRKVPAESTKHHTVSAPCTAIAIERTEAHSIAEAIAGVAQSLELSAPKICGNGGAFEHLQPFRELIEQAIAKRLPTASWIKGQGDALDGALQLALRQLKRNPD